MKPFFKPIFVLAAAIFFSKQLHSQDLIVTFENDSLNCKITKLSEDAIYFTFKHNGHVRNTLIPNKQVKLHQFNYYSQVEIPSKKIVHNTYPHFRAALTGGWSTRTAKLSSSIPSNLKQYSRELKSGHNFCLDLSYYFSETMGMGLKYDVYRSRNEIKNVRVTPPRGDAQNGTLSDDISIKFIGPFFSTRLLDANKKNSAIFNLGLGYLGYKDEAVMITNYTITGATLGTCWDIGYDIGLSENLALGIQLSYVSGILSKVKLSNGYYTDTIEFEKGNYESLAHIDLSVGLRFIK